MTTPEPGPERAPSLVVEAARHEASFHDGEGNPVAQGDPKAVYVEVVSYDDQDQEIARTYATI